MKASKKTKDPTKDETLRRLCGAKLRGKDKRCEKSPEPGGLRCRLHGGASPQAKRTARQRLDALREPAVVALGEIIRNTTTNDSTKVRAALGVLDRAGMGPSSHVEVDVYKPWQKAIMEVEKSITKKAKGKKGKRRTIPGELVDSRTDSPPKPETRQPPAIPQDLHQAALRAAVVAPDSGVLPRGLIEPTPKVKARPTAPRTTKARTSSGRGES